MPFYSSQLLNLAFHSAKCIIFFLTDQYLHCKSSLESGKMLRFEYFRCLLWSKLKLPFSAAGPS